MKILSLVLAAMLGNISSAQPAACRAPLEKLTTGETGVYGGFRHFDLKNIDGRENMNSWNKSGDSERPDLEIFTSKATVDFQSYEDAHHHSAKTKEIPQTTVIIQKNHSGEVVSVRSMRSNIRHHPRISWLADVAGDEVLSVTRCDAIFCVIADHKICAAAEAHTGNIYDSNDEDFHRALKAATDPEMVKRHKAELSEMNKIELTTSYAKKTQDGMVRIGANEESLDSKKLNIHQTRVLCSKFKFSDPAKKAGSSSTAQGIFR